MGFSLAVSGMMTPAGAFSLTSTRFNSTRSLVDGVLAIIAGARAALRHQRWGLLIFEGIADLVAGGIAIVWPLITIVALIHLLAAWAMVSGELVSLISGVLLLFL
jgi:uncharacterized membrane protein HdeD (DUF308 family)